MFREPPEAVKAVHAGMVNGPGSCKGERCEVSSPRRKAHRYQSAKYRPDCEGLYLMSERSNTGRIADPVEAALTKVAPREFPSRP